MRGVLPIFIGRAMASLELQCLSRGVWPGWSLKIRSNDRNLFTFRDSFEPEEVTFQRPEGYKRPAETLPYNRPGRNPELAKTAEETEDPFYFRAEMADPFQDIATE